MPEKSFYGAGVLQCEGINNTTGDWQRHIHIIRVMHDLGSGVEWFTCVYAHGAYFSDSIKPRCDKSSLLLWPSNIQDGRDGSGSKEQAEI